MVVWSLTRDLIGFVFTNGSLPEIKKIIGQFNVGAPAKVGNVAYCQILAEAGPTGQPPDKTGFFQALNSESLQFAFQAVLDFL